MNTKYTVIELKDLADISKEATHLEIDKIFGETDLSFLKDYQGLECLKIFCKVTNLSIFKTTQFPKLKEICVENQKKNEVTEVDFSLQPVL